MNNKQKNQARVAMVFVLLAISIAYSTGGLFAQSESTISENSPIMDTIEENMEVEVLESKEGIQNIERAAGDVVINEANFPDSTFRNYISRNFDTNNNGILSSAEIDQIVVLSLPQNTKSTKGIEYFSNLVFLDCNGNELEELDTSKNSQLTVLFANRTKLKGLDVSKNPLVTLEVGSENLAWVHIGNNTTLQNVWIGGSPKSAIDLGVIGSTFNIKERLPGIEPNRIQSISGASLNRSTGVVSGYVAGTPITYTYNCGTSPQGTATFNVTLNFKRESSIIINDDLNKLYDGVAVANPINITKTGSNGAISFEWYTADGTLLADAPVNVGSYKVKAILAEDGNYGSAEVEKSFEITKASSSIVVNDDLNKVYDGIAVVDPINITKTGSNGAISFEWYTADGTALIDAPVNVGSYKVKVILAEDDNHDGTEVEKGFEITKASSTIVVNDDLNKVYDGIAVTDPKSITKTGSNGAVTFEWYTADDTPLADAPVNVGSYKVKAILAGDANYEGVEVEKAFEITKANSTITINGDLNKIYDGTAVIEPSVTTTGSTGTVTFEWYTVDGTQLQTAPATVGSYKVKVILAEDANHVGAVVEKEFTIGKVASTITINDDLNKVYDGIAVVEPTDIVTTGSTGAVSIEWYTADGTLLQSAPVNAGSYKVKAILAEDTNYAGVEVEKEFTITQAASNIVITVELNKVYDGQPVSEPQVTVTGSTGAITYEWYKKEESTTRVVTWTKLATAPSEVGNYKVVVTVAGDGNFEAVTVEKEFSILGKEVVPTPGTGGGITNPDGTEGPEINPGDKVESNGPVITNPDGSVTLPNGGTVTKPDGSVVIIQPGATFKPDDLMVEGTTTIPGVQTGDETQVGLWTILVGLSTGMMMFFRRKNRKEEV